MGCLLLYDRRLSGGLRGGLRGRRHDLWCCVGEVHGHTDNQGNADKNMQLSEDRAFAVKQWLESQSSANFPKGRVKVFAHGQTQPLESNGSAGGRAKNRRVEIVLGTDT